MTDLNEYESEGYVPAEPFPIRIARIDVPLEIRRAPDYASCMTWTITQSGTGRPTQLLPRRIMRFKGKVTITNMGGATAVVFNSKEDALSGAGQGFALTAVGVLPEWESQQPLYAIGIGGQPVISVIDESYADG